MPLLFERITIAGVGLIGGSLALAARQAGLVGEVVGLGRSEDNLQTALRRGIVDRATRDPLVAAQGTDLLVLAVPVRGLAGLAAACAPALPAHAIVTDVGSVKASVVREVEAVLPSHLAFVGAHPIAGTEDSGAAAAQVDLFRGSRCVLTPGASATPAATAKLRALWEGVGCDVVEMGPEEHDHALAWVSHLPHTIAFSAVNALMAEDPSLRALAGPSFRDLTRVAASSPETWRDIFTCNREAVADAVDKFARELLALREALLGEEESGLVERLRRARDARRSWGEMR